MPSVLAASLALLAAATLAACTTTGAGGTADQETCLTYGGPRGSDGYQACLARLAAQERDTIMIERAEGLGH